MPGERSGPLQRPRAGSGDWCPARSRRSDTSPARPGWAAREGEISADDFRFRERVLEPFFTTRTNGTGLGLAVVNATVSGFSGRLDIQSETDVGTAISITLPTMSSDTILSSDITTSDSQSHDVSRHAEQRYEKFSESKQEKEVSI